MAIASRSATARRSSRSRLRPTATVVNADDLTFAVGGATPRRRPTSRRRSTRRASPARSTSSATSALGVVTLHNLNKVGRRVTNAAATITVVDFAGGDATLGGFYTIVNVTDDAIRPIVRFRCSLLARRSRSRDRCSATPATRWTSRRSRPRWRPASKTCRSSSSRTACVPARSRSKSPRARSSRVRPSSWARKRTARNASTLGNAAATRSSTLRRRKSSRRPPTSALC
jgi:hypothetical protein